MDETTTDATAILAPLWKRKWLILATGVLVAAIAYAYYRHQPTVYSASTQLYLGGAEEQGVLGSTQGRSTLSVRALGDQAEIISSSVLGEAVRTKLRREHKLAAAHGKVSAKASSTDDFITIQAEARTAKGAAELANAYATTYVRRQRAASARTLYAAIGRTRHQLRKIETSPSRAPGTRHGGGSQLSSTAVLQAANLASKINQLESELSLTGVQQVGAAKPQTATLVSPKPRHNAIFGFLIGILLAAFAAYALSRFDPRLRSLADIEATLGAQILTALPKTRAPIVGPAGQPTPAPALLEPLRRLHMALRLGDMLERDRARPPRAILFVSADPGDGKSTLIANLALVQREAGERVVVVEADLRRPVQAELLDVNGAHGLPEVLAGALPIGAALQRVGAAGREGAGALAQAGAAVAVAQAPGAGSLEVLAGGRDVANPPALLGSQGMSELLRGLAEDYDHVLIDAPPPLGLSDVMPLLGAVDGIVLVARVGYTRTTSARRLLELLARASSAPVLGVLANCAANAELRAHGFATGYTRRRAPLKLSGR